MGAFPQGLMDFSREMYNLGQYGESGGPDERGVLGCIKAEDLPAEQPDEFSNAPFEFEETAKWLWEDTQYTYYHACTENRFSENYLKLCTLLEKNIRQVGSFCLTKAVLEQKGLQFPKLSDLNINELVRMVSFHLRKCHAAFRGIYRDNNFIGMSYYNQEFRWFSLGNRLKATEVKIGKIREGLIDVDDLLKQAEIFKGEGKTNDKPDGGIPETLRINPSALPLKGSMARDMLRAEQEEEKKRREREKRWKRAEREIPREMRTQPYSPAAIPDPVPPTPPETENPLDPRFSETETTVSEAEVRSVLMGDAMRRRDQEALMAIPLEDPQQLLVRWRRYIEPPGKKNERENAWKDIRRKQKNKHKKKK